MVTREPLACFEGLFEGGCDVRITEHTETRTRTHIDE
jgi:hypothetical protein